MNLQYLIDSVVQQTASLIAQLATHGGMRSPLSHVESELFLRLSEELESRGVSRKVGADMFGLTTRAYLKKIQRLTESRTEQGRSLWEAIYDQVSKTSGTSRAELLAHFKYDEEVALRGVLHDLVESGLLVATGSGKNAEYRPARLEELEGGARSASSEALAELLWAVIFREGPIARAQLLTLGRRAEEELDEALGQLLAAGRIAKSAAPAGGGEGSMETKEPLYHAEHRVVPRGQGIGWEGAVFDHVHAVVQALKQGLAQQRPEGVPEGTIGGSTYVFDVTPEHPRAGEVFGLLAEFRSRLSTLRAEVDAYNQTHQVPRVARPMVVYSGECALERRGASDEAQVDGLQSPSSD